MSTPKQKPVKAVVKHNRIANFFDEDGKEAAADSSTGIFLVSPGQFDELEKTGAVRKPTSEELDAYDAANKEPEVAAPTPAVNPGQTKVEK